jgi:hypothetical protein
MAIEANGCDGEGKITPPKITTKLKESRYRKNQKLKQYLQEFQASNPKKAKRIRILFPFTPFPNCPRLSRRDLSTIDAPFVHHPWCHSTPTYAFHHNHSTLAP